MELTPETRQRAAGYYSEHTALGERLYKRYTAEQLELLLEFVRGSRVFNERAAAVLEERTRRARRPS